MKRRKNFAIVLICFSLLLISFVYSYYLIRGSKNEKPPYEDPQIMLNNAQGDIDKPEDTEDLPLYNDEKKVIGPNIKIEYTLNYKGCGHKIIKEEEPLEEMIDMKEEQFKTYIRNNYPTWTILDFSFNHIKIEIEKDQLCPNHFVIGVKDGKIAIYKIDDQGKRVLYEKLDKSISLLKEVDQEKLREGIVVNSEEEIGHVLENFIS